MHRKSSLTQICSEFDKKRVCEKDPKLSKEVCVDFTVQPRLCEAFPGMCDDQKNKRARCAENIYDCFADQSVEYGYFCKDFPDLCFKPYQNGKELIEDICKAGNATMPLCENSQPNMRAVCENFHMLGDRVNRKSSFSERCNNVDYEKACTDPQLKDKICQSGVGISESLCQLYPDMCKANTKTEKCTANIYDCFADKENNHYGFFCTNYPDLCYKEYKTGKEMVDDLCKNGFCVEGQPDMYNICYNYDSLPGSIRKKTEFHVLCGDIDFNKVCTDPQYKDNMCPNGKSLSANWCAQWPDACEESSSRYDKCLTDIYECAKDRTARWGYYSERYPEIKREQTFSNFYFQNSTALHNVICKADKDKFCRGGT